MLIQGSQMEWDNSKFSYVTRGLESLGYYEMTKEQLAQYIHKDDLVIDVGAHYGYYTLMMAQLAREVLSFEPDEDNRKILENNIKLNNYTNVTVYPNAVKDDNEIVTLHKSDMCTGMNRIFESEYAKGPSRQVPAVKLDSITNEKIAFIKIDAEEVEDLVLKGAQNIIQKSRPIMLIEYNNDRIFQWIPKNYKQSKIDNNILFVPC